MLKTPPLQTASATIDTLSARLQSATLLEDRRAAILGLRSFAKQYPASVASGSLRELISTLRRDGLGQQTESQDGSTNNSTQAEGGDVDTIRLVLETLLMLFNPDSSSPEASDEVGYFMADGFSMRQDNISLLLSLLDPSSNFADYYSRLYSLQLLSAICGPRPERLQECILSAPLGVSRLVGVLDDPKDAVRNAGLLLLVDLTSGNIANEDLKKIIAFEDVFAKLFSLIRSEGGLAEAGISGLDCLSLLANLVKSSPSNQTMFRESGCVPRFTSLLRECFLPSPLTSEEPGYVVQAREKAAWGLLQLLALFLEPGEMGTGGNQLAFFRAGMGQVLIELAFTADVPAPIRGLALRSAAALIAGNAPLQEAFAGLTIAGPAVPELVEAKSLPLLQVNGARSGASSAKNSARASVEGVRVYIIEALLDLALSKAQEDPGLRAAGCGLIQAYLAGHERIKSHFLQRAIVGHGEGESAANALNSLLRPEDGDAAGVVFASWIVGDLIAENMEAKSVLAGVKEGGQEEGEDEVTFIQALGAQLQSAFAPSQQQQGDERVVAAYASLLTLLLWDFADGVNDLLAEGSGLVQALVSSAGSSATEDPVIAGLAATLLGTVYEFSTKDSAIPRRTLAPLLTQKLGRGKYLNALTQLRREPAIRDFELEDGGVETLLDRNFVELFTLEFSRLRKAIDKDPGIEVLPLGDAEEGVDRDLLDELRQQVLTAKQALAAAQQEALAAGQQREQERMQAAKELQTVSAEVERLGRINRAIQLGHEGELEGLGKKFEEVRVGLVGEHEKVRRGLVDEHQRVLEAERREAERTLDSRLKEQGVASAQRVQEYERRIVEMGNLHRDVQGKHGDAVRQLEAITAQHSQLGVREGEVRRQFEELTQRHERVARKHTELQSQVGEARAGLERVQVENETRRERVTALENAVKEMREELKGKEEELATERAGFGELERELESTKAALAAAQSEVSAAPPAADTETVEKLEKQLHEAREAEKAAKEELDGMLLLMGDIEAKRDGYRDRLKELGGEVTEDEEDDDEDEDEEEE
ncbi:Vesicle-mediated ER to Golgi transport protein [Elasticomyces elasticus]|nr:Vesicle-mediated ER to Golgi transport protein [Elasticomyces elasticus]KAK3658590.1 Vesicle-mediated ER to Golgi transport protein [Elasticomyces elasticus]KAK4906789.1 Vesicle-mediated ER to Golgi transport protein [Elasticomyces elasticus]KAK5766964.1 Vesicle-mediated ER to Golgi transport protein [Elasticomyces elasticus]